MKKWMIYVLIGLLAAGTAFAEEGRPFWKFWRSRAPAAEQAPAEQSRPEPGMMRGAQHGEQRGVMTPERREKMEQFKAQREEVEKLVAAARAETDEVKKQELISQLRAKLTENAAKMHEAFRARLEKAQTEVAKLQKQLADAEKNKDQKIEEHLQKLLAGERPGPGRPADAPKKKGPPPPPVQ